MIDYEEKDYLRPESPEDRWISIRFAVGMICTGLVLLVGMIIALVLAGAR